MLGSPAGHAAAGGGGTTQQQRTAAALWPLAPATHPSLPPAPAPLQHLTAEGYSRYGVYSLFPGAGSPAPGVGVGAALYSHAAAAIGRGTNAATTTFHAHKVTDSLFSSTNYTPYGAPTPPPGSPYSPVPVAQLELLAKNISSSIASAISQAATSCDSIVVKKLLSPVAEESATALVATKDRFKTEKRSTACGCQVSPVPMPAKTKFTENSGGCSRTNPVDWSPSNVVVKREPGIITSIAGGGGGGAMSTPCQVAEVTTSENGSGSPIVKIEATSPTSTTTLLKHDVHISVPTSITTNGNIPVGIAVARQRLQQDMSSSPSLTPAGLLTPIVPSQPIKEIDAATASAGMATVSAAGGPVGAASILQCGDDRTTALAGWPMGGTHGSALATPTLWQYPAPMPVEPMLPLPVPIPPVGFQLVRDPTSGHFLLIPTASLEQLQQAVVWPSYSQPSSHVLLPPMPPPPPLAPLQLLSSATSSDYLATSTTLHQHTQTHSTRLVAVTSTTTPADIVKHHHHHQQQSAHHHHHHQGRITAAANKLPLSSVPLPLPLPAHTLIKIEADCTATATLDHTKTVSVTGFAETPPQQSVVQQSVPPTSLVTTHVFYQHPTANLILSQPHTHSAPTQNDSTACKSQATSPVACLTPPPETLTPSIPYQENEEIRSTTYVQDASNQTENNLGEEELEDVVEPAPVQPQIVQPPQVVIEEVKQIKPDLPSPVIENSIVPELVTTTEPNTKDLKQEAIEEVRENKLANKPDISGLELLSNSIVEFENNRQSAENTPIKYEVPEFKDERQEDISSAEHGDDVLKGIAHMTLKDHENDTTANVDDALGGLGLLCALAEQRFMEEVGERQEKNVEKQNGQLVFRDTSEERRKEKRKSRHSSCEPKLKKFKHNDISEDEVIRENERLERERLSVLRRVTGERGLSSDTGNLSLIPSDYEKRSKSDKHKKDDVPSSKTNSSCSCKDERNNHRSYKSRECDDESKKYSVNNNNNTNKSQQSNYNNDWTPAFMSAVERDMRQQLADLQRQYKEKQLELSKLNPKKKSTTEFIDPKKILNGKSCRKDSPSPPPPILDKMDSPVRVKNGIELLKPPTLCAIVPTEKLKTSSDLPDVKHHDTHKRKLSISRDSSDTTPEKISSSKKRKVGRPKKLMSASGHRVTTTETIVAKKPRAKAGLVGYLLAAKNRLQMQHKTGLSYSESSPPRYSEDTTPPPVVTTPVKNKTKTHKELKNGVLSVNNVTTEDHLSVSKTDNRTSKIRPKLKAEPTVKLCPEDESEPEESDNNNNNNTEDEEDSVEQEKPIPEEDQPDEPVEEIEQAAVSSTTPAVVEDTRCILTSAHLAIDKLRVLTAMGGLFYAGQLTAVRAPDVYAITLDGERGNRPHIMSREEILRDAIVEVSPTSTSELLAGTRLCAYWSQQYRCLYPGTVAEPGTPDPQLDLKFVCVEFDDGDSGRIALEDIRLLPADYPIIEYDPNPLLSLSKRRRRTSVNSVTEERRLNNKQNISANTNTIQVVPSVTVQEPSKSSSPLAEKENTDINRQSEQDSHRERKRLKKRRKEKLKKLLSCHEDKKKRRKHKLCDEHCKHRKHHKKHRKHKKHHHRSENEEVEITEKTAVVEEPEVVHNEISVEEDEEEEENIVPKQKEIKSKKSKKRKERRESVESRSKMAAFLPARQLWGWSGKGYKRVGLKGRARKQFFKAIQRGKESIMVGDCAVFLSTGRPDRPYIGKIEAMWESWGTNMVVRVKWFYHPEETVGCPLNLKYPGALFESPHVDENDVQTISHKCEVLPLKEYTDKLGSEPQRYETIYDNNDIYYLAGYYDPTTTTLTMEPAIPFVDSK